MANAKEILELHSEYEEIVRQTKKVPETSSRLIDEIFINPVISISKISRQWELSFNAVKRGVGRLVKVGILKEVSGRRRNKLYIAPKLMELLSPEKK